jgi:hypothetical protein
MQELDVLSLKYRGCVPFSHAIYYVEWWFQKWHETREQNIDRYISKHVVWC